MGTSNLSVQFLIQVDLLLIIGWYIDKILVAESLVSCVKILDT